MAATTLQFRGVILGCLALRAVRRVAGWTSARSESKEVLLGFLYQWASAVRLQRAWRFFRRRESMSRALRALRSGRRRPAVWCSLTGELRPRSFCVSLVRGDAQLWLHVPTLVGALERQEGAPRCPATRTPLDACERLRVAHAAGRLGCSGTDAALDPRSPAQAARAAPLHVLSEEGRAQVRAVAEVLAPSAGVPEESRPCADCVADACAGLSLTLRTIMLDSVDGATELLLEARRELPAVAMERVYEAGLGTGLSLMLMWAAYQ